MNILFIGDIFASPGRRIVADHLQDIVQTNKIDLAIANAENAAGGFGITPAIAEELFEFEPLEDVIEDWQGAQAVGVEGASLGLGDLAGSGFGCGSVGPLLALLPHRSWPRWPVVVVAARAGGEFSWLADTLVPRAARPAAMIVQVAAWSRGENYLI